VSSACEDEFLQPQTPLAQDIEETLTHNEKNEKKKQLTEKQQKMKGTSHQ
jgi:hypothetical protein